MVPVVTFTEVLRPQGRRAGGKKLATTLRRYNTSSRMFVSHITCCMRGHIASRKPTLTTKGSDKLPTSKLAKLSHDSERCTRAVRAAPAMTEAA